LTPFVSAEKEPPKRQSRQSRLDKDYGLGKSSINAWKMEKHDEYNELKEQWRKYFQETGELAVGSRRRRRISRDSEDGVHIQANNNAKARSEDVPSRTGT
jgi:hypothetical protein